MRSQRFLELLTVAGALVSLAVGLQEAVRNLPVAVLALLLAVGFLIVLLLLRRSEPYEFETLDSHIVLALQDKGRLAQYSKHSRLRALRNEAYFYIERMSAEPPGDVGEFAVSPGTVEQVWREGGDFFVRTTFGRVLRKGEEQERDFRCTFHNAFTDRNDYWVQNWFYPGRHFELVVEFPEGWVPQSFRGVRKIGTYERSVPQPVLETRDGRVCLVWNVRRPVVGNAYKIDWTV